MIGNDMRRSDPALLFFCITEGPAGFMPALPLWMGMKKNISEHPCRKSRRAEPAGMEPSGGKRRFFLRQEDHNPGTLSVAKVNIYFFFNSHPGRFWGSICHFW